jgi:hypothetical protein
MRAGGRGGSGAHYSIRYLLYTMYSLDYGPVPFSARLVWGFNVIPMELKAIKESLGENRREPCEMSYLLFTV